VVRRYVVRGAPVRRSWVRLRHCAPRFGIRLAPTADELGAVRHLARQSDREGLDILGVQDHPYASAHVDAFALMATDLGIGASGIWPGIRSMGGPDRSN
jgi:hypothetical protein